MIIHPKLIPELDPEFNPASLWNRAYRQACSADGDASEVVIAISRPDGTTFVHTTPILSYRGDHIELTHRYVERLVKSLLWIKGGARITIAGQDEIARHIQRIYAPDGTRAFDVQTLGERLFLEPMSVASCSLENAPQPSERKMPLGRHLNGCRIGFDLGGSDRKAAALIDGKVIFSEEITWDPYFQSDPAYHYAGITDSIKRAAAKLPRVDAIGGSAAGVYIDNEPRIASLFRGVSDEDFDRHVRGIFRRIQNEWDHVPFEVANDGEVTALAGAMSIDGNALLGIAMGTSVAAGYCNSAGYLTPALNELAFVPIDYRDHAPVDEWSGDVGCGVQYFCQQGVARLMPRAGIEVAADMPLPERLIHVQEQMTRGDPRAAKIYETIGVCFGYALAHYADFCTIRNLLLLGRTMSGEGGQVIAATAQKVLRAEFPQLAESISVVSPDERFKRHGQAIAAASLPELSTPNRPVEEPSA